MSGVKIMSVKFHLPDFAVHYRFNMVFLSMYKNCPQFFYDGVEIASVYGTFPQSMWNGGRTISGICDKSYVKSVVRAFDKMGIPLRFTFSNPLITEEHLDDEFCNFVLKTAQNGRNGVIVVSPVLEEYIRKNYPEYKITSSTCKRIRGIDGLNAELEKDYDIVVLDYDFNNKFDLLEQVNHKEKCEILVNACCRPECPNRVQHYHDIGLSQIAYCRHLKKHPNKPFRPEDYGISVDANINCPYMNYDAVDIRKHSTHISPEAIYEKYVPMGFSQFKIEGRTLNIFQLIENYIYYMIKPEFKDKARLALEMNLMNNGVLKIHE